MKKIVLDLNEKLEINTKNVIAAIAKEYSLHLNSKYAKDGEIVVVTNQEITNVFEGGSIAFDFERVDGKKVQSHSFYLSYEVIEEKEVAVLTCDFYGSKKYNDTDTQYVNVLDTRYGNVCEIIESKTIETTTLSEAINTVNVNNEKEAYAKYESNVEFARITKSRQLSTDEVEYLEDIHDIPEWQARELLQENL